MHRILRRNKSLQKRGRGKKREERKKYDKKYFIIVYLYIDIHYLSIVIYNSMRSDNAKMN